MNYRRVLLKLSGESFGGNEGKGLNEQILNFYAEEIASVAKQGVQVAIVIGGGNIFRGLVEQTRTRGVAIRPVALEGAEFSLWDCAGQIEVTWF